MSQATLRERAHAKVNLRLRILAREDTGFHQLETVFCRLALHDDVVVTPGGTGLRLVVDGAELGPPEENLAHRAARLWFEAAGLEPAADLRLVKRIPAGAGLGGGSSDAAAVLRALDRWRPLDPAGVLRLGAALGSDVPFFVAGHALALAWGRGERLLPLAPLPHAPVVVAAPALPMATAHAYALLAARRGASPHDPRPLAFDPAALTSWDGMAGLAANDFEALVAEAVPAAGAALAVLREAGGAPAGVTGSGSAVFGVFTSAARAERAAEALRERVPDAAVLETSTC